MNKNQKAILALSLMAVMVVGAFAIVLDSEGSDAAVDATVTKEQISAAATQFGSTYYNTGVEEVQGTIGYVEIGVSDIDSLVGASMTTSVGNNIFIDFPEYKIVEGKLFVFFPFLMFESNDGYVTVAGYNIGVPTTPAMVPTSVSAEVPGNATVTFADNVVTFANYTTSNTNWLGLQFGEADTAFFTKKTYVDGSISYGFTLDENGVAGLLAFYPCGWATKVTDSASRYTNYEIISVNGGYCKLDVFASVATTEEAANKALGDLDASVVTKTEISKAVAEFGNKYYNKGISAIDGNAGYILITSKASLSSEPVTLHTSVGNKIFIDFPAYKVEDGKLYAFFSYLMFESSEGIIDIDGLEVHVPTSPEMQPIDVFPSVASNGVAQIDGSIVSFVNYGTKVENWLGVEFNSTDSAFFTKKTYYNTDTNTYTCSYGYTNTEIDGRGVCALYPQGYVTDLDTKCYFTHIGYEIISINGSYCSLDIFAAANYSEDAAKDYYEKYRTKFVTIDDVKTAVSDFGDTYYNKGVKEIQDNSGYIEIGPLCSDIAGEMLTVSVGNNIKIDFPAYKVEGGKLYAFFAYLMFESTDGLIPIGGYNISVPTTPEIEPKGVIQSGSNGDVWINGTDVSFVNYNVSESTNWVGIQFDASVTAFFTKKTYSDGSYSYGYTDAESGYPGTCAFYPLYLNELKEKSYNRFVDYEIITIGGSYCNLNVYYSVAAEKMDSYSAYSDLVGVDAVAYVTVDKVDYGFLSFIDAWRFAMEQTNPVVTLLKDCTVDDLAIDPKFSNFSLDLNGFKLKCGKISMEGDSKIELRGPGGRLEGSVKGNVSLIPGVEIIIPAGSTYNGHIECDGNTMDGNFMAGSKGVSIRGGSLSFDGDFIETTEGNLITVKGSNIIISGSLKPGMELQILPLEDGGKSNVTLKNFTSTEEDVVTGLEDAYVSLEGNVDVADLGYSYEATSEVVYNGGLINPSVTFKGTGFGVSLVKDSELRYLESHNQWPSELPVGTESVENSSKAGNYTIVYLITFDTGESKYVCIKWSILPASIDLTGSPNKEYDGSTEIPDSKGPIEISDSKGLQINIDSVFKDKDAGTTKDVVVTLTGAGAPNCIFRYGGMDYTPVKTGDDPEIYTITIPGIGTITQKPVTVTADDKSKTYGQDDPELTTTISGLVKDELKSLITYDIICVHENDVGTYQIVLTGDASQGNYTVSYVNGILTIGQKEVTVTANNKTITYGDSEPSFDATVTGLMFGDSESLIAYTVSCSHANDVGTYNIIPDGNLSQGNYSVKFVNGTFKIEPKTITINWSSSTLTYNGTDQSSSVSASFTEGGVNTPLKVELIGDDPFKDKGSYTFKASFIGDVKNYKLPATTTKDYSIGALNLSDVMVIVNDTGASAIGVVPTVIVKSGEYVIPATDYTVGFTKDGASTSTPLPVGTNYTAVVTAEGENTSGTGSSSSFNITYQPITLKFTAVHGDDPASMTVYSGQTITLKALGDTTEFKFVGWSINGLVLGAQYTVTEADADSERIIELEAVWTPVPVAEPSMTLIGSGFYTDAAKAEQAMKDMGANPGPVDRNTMFIVWNQSGCLGKFVNAYLYLDGEMILHERMLSDNGTRAWLFSDQNHLSAHPFQDGIYKMVITVANDDTSYGTVVLTDIVVVDVPETVEKVTVSFAVEGSTVGAPASKTVDVGTPIILPTLSDDGYTFLGWYAENDYIGFGQYIATKTVTLTGKFVPVTKDPYVELIGSGFYLNAADADAALEAFGSGYDGGVDDRTMLIVWYQNGFVGKTVTGTVIAPNGASWTQNMNNENGIRAWLFSDKNELREMPFIDGVYTIVIKVGNDVLITKEIVVDVPEKVCEVKLDDVTIGYYAEGEIVMLPVLNNTSSQEFMGWTVGGNTSDVYNLAYTVSAADVTAGAVSLSPYFKPVTQKTTFTVTFGVDGQFGKASVVAGGSIALPTLPADINGNSFLGWQLNGAGNILTGYYTPAGNDNLIPAYSKIVFKVDVSVDNDDVKIACNSEIAKGSFGLLVITAKPNIVCTVSVTSGNAFVSDLGNGSYMIFNVTGDVVITVTTSIMPPSGVSYFNIVGALPENSGFRVEMASKDAGGLYAGTVTLKYTYSKVVDVDGEDVTYYFEGTASDSITVGTVTWSKDFTTDEGPMYYAYAEYTVEGKTTITTLGVLAPELKATSEA